MKPKICVVGSANIDQVSYVKRAPNDGETLFGEDYQMGFGGKGANQAVMAGLLGAEVYVIACLGSCLLYTSPSPRDLSTSRMPSSA